MKDVYVVDANGNFIRKLEEGDYLRDGERISRNMMFRDAATRDQATRDAATRDAATRDAIAFECCAPGPPSVFLDGSIPPGVTVMDSESDPRFKSYLEYDKRLGDAWQHGGLQQTNDGIEQLQQQRDQAIASGDHEKARELAYELYDRKLATAYQRKEK